MEKCDESYSNLSLTHSFQFNRLFMLLWTCHIRFNCLVPHLRVIFPHSPAGPCSHCAFVPLPRALASSWCNVLCWTKALSLRMIETMFSYSVLCKIFTEAAGIKGGLCSFTHCLQATFISKVRTRLLLTLIFSSELKRAFHSVWFLCLGVVNSVHKHNWTDPRCTSSAEE